MPPNAPLLPQPDPAAAAHAARVAEHLRQRIHAAGGALRFAEFMQEALYAPGLGYYSAGLHKFGADGDFVTAPEISPLFARSLARPCADALRELGGGEILEFGAGSGVMAAELLAELERLDALPRRYAILELSADLRQRQQATLAQRLPHLAGRVQWLDRLPESLRGVILANEVLDAMPVQRFRLDADGAVEEFYVRAEADGFAWQTRPADADLSAAVAHLNAELDAPLPPDYVSEYNPHLSPWIAALGGCLHAGLVLLLDYGFPRREYYHPQRAGGTLMCHYRHHSHADPLWLPGLQDITAHVDFTAVAEAALATGLSVAGYTSQADFLLGCGLDRLLEHAAQTEPETYLRQVQAAKRLIMPEEMGELFKVIALRRGLRAPLCGFERDRRGRL